jgi:hypothetical protein
MVSAPVDSLPRTLDEVLVALDQILDECQRERTPLGYFPALYRHVTQTVGEGIRHGDVFKNGARMEKLDVAFANRYLAAWAEWRQGGDPSRCWRVAFEAWATPRMTILQHLLLGMNAHINFDLAIAAAQTCPGAQIHGLQADFMAINEILADLLDDVKEDLAALSPWLGLLDRLGGRSDDALVNFSMRKARDMAWSMAVKLAEEEGAWDLELATLDLACAGLGRLVARPPGLLLRAGLGLVRLRECREPGTVIQLLRS